MDIRRPVEYSSLALILVGAMLASPVNAAVKYMFTVTVQPALEFHVPFVAELTLSDAAVSAGQAVDADIESLRITGGTAVREDNPLTLSHLHTALTDLSVTLSDDRQTVTAVSALIAPQSSPAEEWVLYQSRPPHPELEVHENLGYVSSAYVRLDTLLLPVPPTLHSSVFRGEWRREPACWPCRVFREWLDCFPFCPWPWVIILVAVIFPVMVWRIRRS